MFPIGNRTPAMMGVVPYRFNDSFMAAGRKVSATTRDGRDFWTTAVTPSGFIASGFESEAQAFMPYLVQDNRDYDSVVLAKGPWHYWRSPVADMSTVPDLGANPDDMVPMATPVEMTQGNPVVRNGGPSIRWPLTTVVNFSNNRYRVNRSSDLWSSLNPANSGSHLANFTVEAWYRPNLNDTSNAIYVARQQPGFLLYHQGTDRVNFRVYKSDGVAFTQAGEPTRSSRAISAGLNGSALHFVGTYDGLTAKMYVNGVLVASADNDYVPDQLMYDPTGADVIVPLSTGVSGNFPTGGGEIGCIAMYPRALSAAEVAENYLVGAPVK